MGQARAWDVLDHVCNAACRWLSRPDAHLLLEATCSAVQQGVALIMLCAHANSPSVHTCVPAGARSVTIDMACKPSHVDLPVLCKSSINSHQLYTLTISHSVCVMMASSATKTSTSVHTHALQVTRTHPDAIDSDHVAMHRRAVAAKAVSGRVCRHLLPLLPLLRAPAAGNNEEQHLRHLQEAIDRYTEDRTAANCVRLADGGSMWLQ